MQYTKHKVKIKDNAKNVIHNRQSKKQSKRRNT